MRSNELPETIYTLQEAAERLRTTPRVLARIARRYGRCAEIGRSLRFSEADIAALWQAIRIQPKEPWAFHASTIPAPSDLRLSQSLRELMKRPRQAKSRPPRKP